MKNFLEETYRVHNQMQIYKILPIQKLSDTLKYLIHVHSYRVCDKWSAKVSGTVTLCNEDIFEIISMHYLNKRFKLTEETCERIQVL